MNNFSLWFRRQTAGTRIALIVVLVAAIITGIASLSQSIRQGESAEPVETIEPATVEPVEPSPSATATPTPEEPDLLRDAPVDDEGGYSIIPNDKSSFTNADLETLPKFMQDASIEFCHVIEGETSEARIARLSTWFDPSTNAMTPNTIAPILKARQCTSLGVIIGQPDSETGDLPVTSNVIMYTVTIETSPGEPTTANASTENFHSIVTFRDGKWIIIDNS